MRSTVTAAVALPLTAAVIAILGGCDQGRQDTTYQRRAAPTQLVDESVYSVDSGTGGRSSQDRGTGDPLRYSFYGEPQTAPLAPQHLVLWNDGYVLGYDVDGKSPVWACYRLFDSDKATGKEHKRRDRSGTSVDTRLPATSDPAATLAKDKKAEGSVEYVLVPPSSIAACYGEGAGDEAYLSSAALTHPGRNGGSSVGPGWTQLADLEPAYAKAYGEVWVMCGPLGSGEKSEGLWKIQVTVQDGHSRVQAFIVPANADRKQRDSADLATRLVPVHEIEQRTGLTFFSDYHDVSDDDNRKLLETQVPAGLWPTTAPAAAPLPSVKTASRQGMAAGQR
jgi:DNA/RNA endonuclease G (NUC1)